MGWDEATSNRERAYLHDALVLQFNLLFGTDEEDLRLWHNICNVLQISPVPESIASCREVSWPSWIIGAIQLIRLTANSHSVLQYL
jgi:hypothetical protein